MAFRGQRARDPSQEHFWFERSKRFLKAELKRRQITYAELARRLTALGLAETEGSITVKINRGRFSVPFLLATTAVIGAELIMRDDDGVVSAHRVFQELVDRIGE